MSGTEKSYTVLEVSEVFRPNETMEIELGHLLTVKTKGGVIFHLEIPQSDFTATKVSSILTKKAQNIDKVLQLLTES